MASAYADGHRLLQLWATLGNREAEKRRAMILHLIRTTQTYDLPALTKSDALSPAITWHD